MVRRQRDTCSINNAEYAADAQRTINIVTAIQKLDAPIHP
jgi:hypothetical protein